MRPVLLLAASAIFALQSCAEVPRGLMVLMIQGAGEGLVAIGKRKNESIQETGAQYGATAQPAGYSTPSASNAPAPLSTAATAVGIPGESKYMIEAERLAKSTGCAAPVAAMNFKGEGSELFTIACSMGALISIRCDADACRVTN